MIGEEVAAGLGQRGGDVDEHAGSGHHGSLETVAVEVDETG